MKKIYFTTLLAFIFLNSSVIPALAQTVSIASFVANPSSVISENSVTFSYGGNNITSYKLSLQCPSGVNAPSPEGDNCNGSISLPNLDGPNSYSVKFTNSTSVSQNVSATLTAFGGEQDSRTITVTVLPKTSASISSFVANPSSIISENTVAFSYGGNEVSSYKLSLQCPNGVTAPSPEGDVCNNSSSLPNLDGPNNYSVKFTNNTSARQNITVTLKAYNTVGSEQDSRTITVTVLPKVSASAHITSFTLDQTSIPTTLYSNKPAAHIVTNFSADNVDIYKIRLECPLPTTIAGVEERIDLIDSGGQGVTSPSIEGEQCNVTQTGSASLKQFSFILLNPFKTPQSVNLILQAYSWDGSKNVFGDEQSKTITVLPI